MFSREKINKVTILRLFTAWALIICLGLGACNKSLEIDSKHSISEENQWSSITDTRSSLLGIYGLFRAALADNNAHWLYGEMREGDFQSYVREDLRAINVHNLNSSYKIVEDLKNWRRFYAVINAASIFIEKAPKVLAVDPLYTEQNMKIDIAQARVLRAFAYFYMARVWGDVPLLTQSYDNGSFEEMAKNTQDQVLAYAEREILASVEQLPYLYGESPQTYYSYTTGRWNGVLFNKNSAYSILSHIAAWRGNYMDAEVYTNFVLTNYTKSSANYITVANMVASDGFFYDKNANQLVALNFVYYHGEATKNGHLEELTLAAPLVEKPLPEIFVPKDSISIIFNDPNATDQRFGIDTVSGLVRTNYFTNYSGATPLFSKLKVIRGGSTDGTFAVFSSAIVFSRLEDIVLLRAEALAALNRGTEALSLLNNIRSRRGLATVNPTSNSVLLDEIFAERRRELMGEGHRWYDQVRYNRLKPVNTNIVSKLNNGGIYWPLASEVLKNNSKLTQNPFWK